MGPVLLIAGIIVMVISGTAGLVENGAGNAGNVSLCIKFLSGGFVSACIGGAITMRNNFCILKTGIDEKEANIEVYTRQRTDLEKTLKDLLEKYIAHEKGLLDLVKERSTENLMALLERYPDLKANDGVMKLAEQLTGLRKTISNAETAYNNIAQEYNAETMQFPQKHFLPGGLPKIIEYKK
jgi:hypothetical protein